MYLKSLDIERFRSCAKSTIEFQSDLTVLVGENNGGKSNILDAIRLLTLPLNRRRERYPDDDDIQRDSSEQSFSIEGQFSGMSETVKGLLISAVPDPAVDLAIIGMRYTSRADAERGKTVSYAGRFDDVQPEQGATDLIRHVFLPPLRDARQALGSGSATRLTTLLQHFLKPGEERELIEYVRRPGDPHRVVGQINDEIGLALGDLTRGVREQAASLGFGAEDLSDIARDLRFRMADAGIEPEDIRRSGLGYANLLFIATVVIELARARQADLTLFLVEEPEAHLHPQLQMLVLNFLLEQARKSASVSVAAGHPEGHIQVIVTTHSPNLTAWIRPEHLVVVRSVRIAGTKPKATQNTLPIPIAKLGLENRSLRKIGRYLDVTRSALLFGSRALLVEGIAEAMLLPVLARNVTLKGQNQALQRFRGTLIVAIDGVDFRPYVEVLIRPYNNATIADSVIVVTDNDPGTPGNRRADLEHLAGLLGTADRLTVITNVDTLEYELFMAGNEALLKRAFLDMCPSSGARWEVDVVGTSDSDRARSFVSLLKSMRVRKGDYAQRLAEYVESGEPIHVPAYLERAVCRAART